MKQVTLYGPYLIASAAILAAVYFLWYKPKKDAEATQNAALQAESDKELTKDDPTYTLLKKALASGAGTFTEGKVSKATTLNWN